MSGTESLPSTDTSKFRAWSVGTRMSDSRTSTDSFGRTTSIKTICHAYVDEGPATPSTRCDAARRAVVVVPVPQDDPDHQRCGHRAWHPTHRLGRTTSRRRARITRTSHVAWITDFLGKIDLNDIVLMCQLGALIGLRGWARTRTASPASCRQRFLPTGDGKIRDTFLAWQNTADAAEVPVGGIIKGGCVRAVRHVSRLLRPFPTRSTGGRRSSHCSCDLAAIPPRPPTGGVEVARALGDPVLTVFSIGSITKAEDRAYKAACLVARISPHDDRGAVTSSRGQGRGTGGGDRHWLS